MAAIAYTKAQFIERVKKHLANGFAKSSFPITNNEILLLIDSNIPIVMKGQMFENVKVTGMFETPEAYLVTYELTILQDSNTQEWVATLPQPPVALPLGYSLTRAYFSIDGFQTSDIFLIKGKRTGYRDYMPKPTGLFARVVNSEFRIKGNENQNLYSNNVFVEMATSRTVNLTDTMNLPDDAISLIFDKTVATLMQRYNIPQDIVKDNLPSGNKGS